MRWVLAVLWVVVVAVVFWPPPTAEFVFDDRNFVLDNPVVTSGDLWRALTVRHEVMANRPFVAVALTLQWAAFDGAASGFRCVSLLLHLLNGWLVFLVARATLRAPNLGGRWSVATAWWTAAAIAAVWSLHPLVVDSVAYVVQQSMLLMAACGLGALWLLGRTYAQPERPLWAVGAVACTALGMACKEEMAPAPLVMLLYARAFLVPSWRQVGARRELHGALAASWAVLLWCIAAGPPITSVGWHVGPHVGPWQSLLTQAGVVVHYFGLAVWPGDLRGCYDWPFVRELVPALLPMALLLLLVAGGVALSVRRPALGFLLVWPLLWLAPSSSVLPIVTEVAAERRMYLPLLAVVAIAVVGGSHVLRQWSPGGRFALAAAVAAGLGVRSHARVPVYATEAAFWADAVRHRDAASRSYVAAAMHDNEGRMRRTAGDLAGARAAFAAAVACEGATASMRLHHVTAVLEQGDGAAAVPLLMALAAVAPQLADEQVARAERLLAQHRQRQSPPAVAGPDPLLAEAALQARIAVGLAPGSARAAATMATVLAALGKGAEAEAGFRRAIELEPDAVVPHFGLAELLIRAGRAADADAVWAPLLMRRPQDVELRLRLAQAWLRGGHLDFAQRLFDEVLRLEPEHAVARAGLAQVAAQRRR